MDTRRIRINRERVGIEIPDNDYIVMEFHPVTWRGSIEIEVTRESQEYRLITAYLYAEMDSGHIEKIAVAYVDEIAIITAVTKPGWTIQADENQNVRLVEVK